MKIKSVFAFLSLTFALITHADILIIGDSHTVGPFGDFLHRKLADTNQGEMVISYGHSSSAPIHWMDPKPTKLSGGLNHRLSYNGVYYPHPDRPDWRQLLDSIYLIDVLNNPLIHPEWKVKVTAVPHIETVVFALGANDRKAVSKDSGERTPDFNKRVEILDKMLKEIESRGLKCVWIGPPSSVTRSKALEQTTQEYLIEGIKNRCPLYDSRKFVAKHCDKVHFNCLLALPTAMKWAHEAANFVNANK